MALSESSEIAISRILNVPGYDLTTQISFVGSRLTAGVQSAIETLITEWDAGTGAKHTRLYPTESNKGVKTDPGSRRGDIKREIAILLERPDWASSGSYLARG